MFINDDNILKMPNDVLRQKCNDVELPLSKQDEELLISMLEYVRNTHDEEYCNKNNCRPSVGIAAPQIGIAKKMIAISVEDDEKLYEFALVNPKIISNSTKKAYLENGESCLSVVPDVQGLVPRFASIKVRAYNLLSKQIEDIRVDGYISIVMQHELDHLNGVLYFDKIDKKNPFKEIENAIVI